MAKKDKSWFCPVCRNYFDDEDPGLMWGKCPECGSTCTYLGPEDRYFLADAFLKHLSREYSLPVVDITDLEPLEDARAHMSRDECLKLTAVPIRLFGDVLVVAVAAPELFRNWMKYIDMERAQDVRVRLVIAGVEEVISMVLRTYG
jgi:hypothetical protein